MDKTKPIYIYQLDPNDHSRVVAWWDRIRDFHQFIDRIPSDWPEYEMYWCFSDDYENAKELLVILNGTVRNHFNFDEYREKFKEVSFRRAKSNI
jgi:hypothetical protein